MPAVVVGMIGMDCIGRVSLLVTCQLIGGVRWLMLDDNCEIVDDKRGHLMIIQMLLLMTTKAAFMTTMLIVASWLTTLITIKTTLMITKTTIMTIKTTLITTMPLVASWRVSPIRPSHSSCPCWARLQALSSF